MQYKSVKGFSGWTQLGFLFAFLGLGFILTLGVQFILLIKLIPEGASLSDKDVLLKAIMAPENVTIARVSQVLGTLSLLFIPALLWSVISNGNKMFWLGFSKYINVAQVLLATAIIFAAGFAAAPLADLSKTIVSHFPSLDAAAKAMEKEYNEQALALSNLRSMQEYVVALFIMAFFPAMFEEVFFRGAVQNLFVKWLKSPLTGIVIASLVFSLIHMSVYLFLSRFVLGIALGLMFHLTKNIWVNIIAHFINNAAALTQLYLVKTELGKPDLSSVEPQVHWSIGLIGLGALVFLFFLLRKYSFGNKQKIEAKENLLIAEADPFRSFADTDN